VRVAIVHYHLNPGGVTRVIEAASQALTNAGIQHVILTVETIPALGYRNTPGDFTPQILTDSLRATAHESLGGSPDVWHFHNHSLGKNCLVAETVALLAEAGERIVLQIHDLAESGRPANYHLIADCQKLYPISPRTHYAFLNSRDLKIFTDAGLPPENACLLPNAITPLPHAPLAPAASPILFAPIRGIRRKNIGELVFLSALVPSGTRIAISRTPQNPEAISWHDIWRKFATSLNLPIEFGVTDRLAPVAGVASDFESWIRHSTHFITTSVEEGFGFTFLESITHGKPLLGRNLPHLTVEHTRHGIRHGQLYDQLLIPADWIEPQILKDFLTLSLERNFHSYRRAVPNDIASTALASLMLGNYLDFGNLPEALQQAVMERLSDPINRTLPLVKVGEETQPVRDWLAATVENRIPTATPDQLAPYSLAEYQKKLAALYSHLVKQPGKKVSYLPTHQILTAHLKPELFHFLLSAWHSNLAPPRGYRAAIFDIYGTLLIAPTGGVKPDLAVDPKLREILENFGYTAPESPSTELHAAVVRHHAAAEFPFPEVDLRVLWREILGLELGTDTTSLVETIEAVWHPSQPMPGAADFIGALSRSGISLGLLSNAQSNTLFSLGEISALFSPELIILSYQHGMAKPAPELFQILANRLAGRGISPAETLFIGNDPLHDIVPATAAGFQTVLFTGHPDSLRPGDCQPDFIIQKWTDRLSPKSLRACCATEG
jgi:FMN phosphatase YigB (HAD superfamily)/glycosyltransferase involved in cell wall biosynthesis